MNRYLKEIWVHIYTDGSSQEDSSARASFYCKTSVKVKNFETEIKAIKQTVHHLSICTTSLNHAVFLVDSQSAIPSLCSFQHRQSIHVMKSKLKIDKLINDGWVILFQYIPSNCYIPGNTRADRLAKQGCRLPQPLFALSCNPIFSTVIRATNNYIKNIQSIDAVGKV